MKQNNLLHSQLDAVSSRVKMEMDWSCAIVNKINTILERDDISQRELAKKIGCNETQITRWIRGFPNYTLKSLAALSDALGEPLIIV